VQCGTDINLPANTGGSATATDVCDPSPMVTFADHAPIEVTSTSLGGWVLDVIPGAFPLPNPPVTQFTAGPGTAPLPTGSLRLAVGSDGGSIATAWVTGLIGARWASAQRMKIFTWRSISTPTTTGSWMT
jgi:hypothetical protein